MLIFLHKLLNKEAGTNIKESLMTLASLNIGWFNKIQTSLEEYELPNSFEEIKGKTIGEWTILVDSAIERRNKERLTQMCYKKEEDLLVLKTKTETIAKKLDNAQYKRKLETEFLHMTKNETKTILIARYGMLQCGKNYRGTDSLNCSTCNEIDDENHRLNYCPKWRFNNLLDTDESVNFNHVYSNDVNVLKILIPYIQKVWNVRNGHGSIRTE